MKRTRLAAELNYAVFSIIQEEVMIRKMPRAFGPSILAVEGALDMTAGADLLTNIWSTLVDRQNCIVVDLSMVSRLETEMAEILLQLRDFLIKKDCRLVLLDASKPARQSLEAASRKDAA